MQTRVAQYYLSAGGIVLVEVQVQLFVCILNHRYLVIDSDVGLLEYSYYHQFLYPIIQLQAWPHALSYEFYRCFSI